MEKKQAKQKAKKKVNKTRVIRLYWFPKYQVLARNEKEAKEIAKKARKGKITNIIRN